MKLRRELLLLRDGTAQETEIRTNKIAQLGRALEACAARRQFRGHETAVRTVAAAPHKTQTDNNTKAPWLWSQEP